VPDTAKTNKDRLRRCSTHSSCHTPRLSGMAETPELHLPISGAAGRCPAWGRGGCCRSWSPPGLKPNV